MAVFIPHDTVDRDDAAAFAGRVARWDPSGPVRLRADGESVRMFATTPFDALVSRTVAGRLEPRDVTVHAGNLLSGLAVSVRAEVDPGTVVDASWRSQLPPPGGWIRVDDIPAQLLADLADQGVTQARDNPGPAGGASTSLLDSEVLNVTGAGMNVSVPLRMLFALSGMGFAPTDPGEQVRVSATDSWVRIDARFGAVLRRRHSLLPLLM
ncbi:hypothetical protein ABIB25_001237 [Nakamurella sp. UYEF19]|uniref:hypothetical protein n=1 Tax=Nakamurella sp. UYEF19 TaxID=1756392 RepID=UPI00339792FB